MNLKLKIENINIDTPIERIYVKINIYKNEIGRNEPELKLTV